MREREKASESETGTQGPIRTRSATGDWPIEGNVETGIRVRAVHAQPPGRAYLVFRSLFCRYEEGEAREITNTSLCAWISWLYVIGSFFYSIVRSEC